MCVFFFSFFLFSLSVSIFIWFLVPRRVSHHQYAFVQAARKKQIDMLLHEIRIFEELKHPNIIGFHGASLRAGRLYFCTEFATHGYAVALSQRALSHSTFIALTFVSAVFMTLVGPLSSREFPLVQTVVCAFLCLGGRLFLADLLENDLDSQNVQRMLPIATPEDDTPSPKYTTRTRIIWS